MGNLFDAILILSLAAITVICYKLGFVKLLRPFRKIAALVLAWCLKGTAIIQGTIGKIIKTDKFKVFLTERVDALWGEKIENALTADGVSVTERFDDIFGFWGKMFSDIKDFCISLYDNILNKICYLLIIILLLLFLFVISTNIIYSKKGGGRKPLWILGI